jgi:broad specificity phosphatase PhoE
VSPVYLVRHGETDWALVNERRLIAAANDFAPLTPEGTRQILAVAETLRGLNVGLVLASPMTRALQSAALLSRALDVPLRVEFDLHEWVPDLTYTWDSAERVDALYAELLRAGGEWPADGPRPVWEPLSAVRRRAQRVLARYDDEEATIAVATHAVVIAALTGRDAALAEVVPYERALVSAAR